MEEARNVYVWLVHELSGFRGAVDSASGGFIPYRLYLISLARVLLWHGNLEGTTYL